MNDNYGLHLIADAYVKEDHVGILSSKEQLRSLISNLVSILDMEILLGPELCSVELDPSRLGTDQDHGGITAFCVITTSHISLHTWPLQRRISIDVYSCKSFDSDKAKEFLHQTLGVDKWETIVIERKF